MLDRSTLLGAPLAIALLATTGEAATHAYRYDGATGATTSELQVQVATNLHSFEIAVGSLKAKAHLDLEAPEGAAAWLDIPVAGLTTQNLTRDAHLRDLVLVGDTHPVLRYRSRGFVGSPEGDLTSGWRGTLRGVLELAGMRRPTPVPVELRHLPDGRLLVRGQVDLDIRRFGLRPPDRVVVRVEPMVAVRFELRLAPGGTVSMDVPSP
jgi:polyisoprenoid-binding protein YceI